jgi:hypothetical protein
MVFACFLLAMDECAIRDLYWGIQDSWPSATRRKSDNGDLWAEQPKR